jgi:transposase
MPMCREGTPAHRQVRDFAGMLTERRGHQLVDWISDVETNESPALRSFGVGLRHDLAAVTAGLTLAYNSGAVEGTVNRKTHTRS